MKHNRLFLLVVVLSLFLSTINVFGKGIILEYDQPRIGVVIDVIDGNAIRVMYINSKLSITETKLIRLVGVNTLSSDKSYEYSKEQLLGKPVFILEDKVLPTDDGYTFAYVFLNTDESYNELLLRLGYGELDENHLNAQYYQDLVDAQFIAVRQELGIYKTSETPVNILNINTASSTMLETHLNISKAQANSIINYRTYNPINSSEELGYINSVFTLDFIKEKRSGIHYITDINTATVYELSSLFNTFDSLNKAYDISRERIFSPFTEIEELKYFDVVFGYYELMEPFLTVELNNNILIETDKSRINVNTANKTELIEIGGLTESQATILEKFRNDTAYPIYSIFELSKANFPMQNYDMNKYSDELVTRTNVNTAGEVELKSLFSSFGLSDHLKNFLVNKIISKRPMQSYSDLSNTIGPTFYKNLEPYIYLDTIPTNQKAPININTAEQLDIANYLNLEGDLRSKVTNRSYAYTSAQAIDFESVENVHLITLNTNINTASYEELMNMNSQITPTLAKKIIEYRSYYPLYNLADIEQLLEENDKYYIYDLIKNNIVFY